MDIIAYFDTSHEMPEEVISAAGFTPYKILGNVHVTNDSADQYLPNFFCPAAKSWLTEALSRSGDWKGIIFAQGCNTSNRQIDIWKRHVATPFLYWYNGPLRNDAVAEKFMKTELKKLVSALEDHFNTHVTGEKLTAALEQSNAIKTGLRKLSGLRAEKDIPNREYLEVNLASLKLPKDEVLTMLDKTLEEWNKKPPFPHNKKKVLLTGSDVTYPEWMDMLDECDIRVVRDDLSIGERYFAETFPGMDDPLDAIVYYYMHVPRPATKPPIQKRIDFLLHALEQTKVDGIVSQNLKFCEPFAYDAVTVNNELKSHGYKLIHVEREFTPVSDHQIINRLSAFTETL